MKRDGSVRDTIKDRNMNRFAPNGKVITNIKVDTSLVFKRKFNGKYIRFAGLYGRGAYRMEFVHLEDMRQAGGPHVHDTSEKNSDTHCIINGARHICVEELSNTKLFPRIQNRTEGKGFIQWAEGGFKGAKRIYEGRERVTNLFSTNKKVVVDTPKKESEQLLIVLAGMVNKAEIDDILKEKLFGLLG